MLLAVVLPQEWFTRLRGEGRSLPNLDDICVGPVLRSILVRDSGSGGYDGKYDSDYLGINSWFMEMLFELMPALVGKNIWKGTARCGRNPKYRNGDVPIGSFEELVTTSDMAFLVWAFENYYTIAETVDLLKFENGRQVETELGVSPKWTRQAARRYDGWSPQGKERWNYYMKDMKLRMESGNPSIGELKERFSTEWKAKVGLSRVARGKPRAAESEAMGDLVTSFDFQED